MRFLIAALLLMYAPGSFSLGVFQHEHNGKTDVAQKAKSQHQTTVPSTVQPNGPAENNGKSPRSNEDHNQSHDVTVVSIPKVGIKPDRDCFDILMLIATFALAVAGIFGTRAAIRTLREIKRQADTLVEHAEKFENLARATKDIAAAAKASADALINSERAWIMVDVELPDQTAQIQQFPGSDGSNKTRLKVKLICRNKGRSPAWIIEHIIQVDLKSLLPEIPSFKNPRISHSYIPVPVGGDESIPLQLTGEGWAVEGTGTETYVYGIVKYRDTFGPDKETWFGYFVNGNTLSRIQSHEYNKHV